jgi:hypothetical protein
MSFLRCFTILAIFLVYALPSLAEQVVLNGDQEIILGNGKKLSFSELDKISGSEKDNIINAMTDSQFTSYDQYMEASIKQQEAENKKMEASIKQKDALLNKGYTLYLSNIENGSPGERKILNEIISDDDRPQELKNRARAILNNEKKYKLK